MKMPTLQSGTLFSLKTLFVGLLLLTTFFLGQANNNDNISGPEDGPETALLNAGNDTWYWTKLFTELQVVYNNSGSSLQNENYVQLNNLETMDAPAGV